MSVLLGNGTFRAAVRYDPGASPRPVIAGDFHGDGKVDLTVANVAGNSVSVLLNNGCLP